MSVERQLGFYAGICGFACGIAAAYLYGASFAPVALLCMASALCFVFSFVYTRPAIRSASYVCIMAAIAIVYTSLYTQAQQAHNSLDAQLEQRISMTGWVSDEPDVRDFNTRLTIYLPEYNTSVLAKLPHYPHYSYGDSLELTGLVRAPEAFITDTQRYFDYPHYLEQQGITHVISYPDVTVLEGREGSAVRHYLFVLKHDFLEQLRYYLPEPHVSLMGGLLLGAKSAMGEGLLEDFRTTGVIHIVVLSGFNITIVVGFVMLILSYTGLVFSSIVGSIAILLFALMTGAGATIVRASLMAFLVILARLTGNNALAIRMLFLSGFIMLVFNPMLLLYNPSFQLSFVATLGLIALSPYISSLVSFIPNPKYAPLRELVSATIATQIMVTPLLLYMMGTFPTYSPITNFLILATIPYAMGLGLLTAIGAYISPLIAWPASALSYILLDYSLKIVELFASLPFASFTVPPFGFVWVIVTYGMFALVGYVVYKKSINKTSSTL